MLRSRPKGKNKVEESICIEPSDQRSVFPSEKPVDTMSFPYKFIALMTIAFSIVLLLLCGHSGAAPAFPHKKCTTDYECNQGEFCRQKFGASYCAPCLECNRYNREPSRRCARLRTDCGPCLAGFGELGPHCSRLVKENVTSNATDQTSKHEPGATVDQSEKSSIWLLACVTAVSVVVVIVMAIGLVYTCKRRAGGATEVPKEVELRPFHPSAPAWSNLSNHTDSVEGPPEAWSNPHVLKGARSIRIFHRDQSAQRRVKGYNLLHKANSFGCPVAVTEGGGIVNIHNNNAPPADNNNGDQEALLGHLEHEINQEFVPNPQGQVPNDINDEHELNEDSIDLGQLAGNDDDDANEINENNQVLNNNNNNNDHRIDMDDNNVPNPPQGVPEEPEFQFEINLEIGGLLRAASPAVDEGDPMDAVGPEEDHIVPTFPSMDSSSQNTLPVPQDPQQLAEEMRQVYGVEMSNNAMEEYFRRRGNQQ